ncbi:MAG TPA: hypothetical protein VK327_05415, partial [Candidatus Paceibacterota bacterium]|nr:hypothetical protein [Candidatus Paceibacterota bacterium]
GNNIWIFPGQAQSTRPISWTLDQQTLRLQPSGSQIGWVNQPIQLNAISIETNISSDHVDFILGAQATVFPMSSQYYLHTIGSLGTATNPPYNVSWSPTQIGTFYVWARSTNSQGIVHESAPTTFQVLAENDLFSHATVIAPETQSANFNFYTQTASAEPSEPLRYGKAAQYTLWWKWTPSYSGTVRIKAIRDYSYTGVPIGLPVEVFAGNDLQHLRRLASNRNKVGIAGLSGIVRLKFQAGKTYYVRTDEYSPGPMPVQPNDGSPATLSIEPVSQPLPGELNFSLIVGYRNQNGLSVPIAFARVFGTDGKTPLVGYSFGGGYGGGSGSGPNYVAQLYAARTRPELAPVGSVRPFASSWSSARPFPWAGLFSPTPIVLPGIMAGERVFAQIRVWDSNYGDSFENARANGSPTGTSEIVNVVAGSEETGGTLLLGIKSFSLHKGTSGN